jgi:SPP1 family predicted phage head-tail adaptor
MAGKNNIGVMDQRVTFQSEVTADDGQGGRTSSGWSNIASTPTMWAEVTLSDGTEGDQGEGRQANRYTIGIKIRNRSDVTEVMAVLWRGNRYNIRSITPFDARREFLMIKAEGGVPL